jgi:hypothetical protein
MVTNIDIQNNRNQKLLLKAYEEIFPVIKSAREEANKAKKIDASAPKNKEDSPKSEPVLAYDKNLSIQKETTPPTYSWKA